MIGPAVKLLLDTVLGFLTYAFLLRFAMQWLRAPFRNPLGQALVAITDWAVQPLRRLLPGYRGLDWSTLLLAWFTQFLWLAAVALLVGGGLLTGANALLFAAVAVVELIKAVLNMVIVLVLVQAVLSWVAPHSPVAPVLNALTYPLLAPLRRRIPPLGGTLDLTPVIVIVAAQLLLMLPVHWLEVTVIGLFR